MMKMLWTILLFATHISLIESAFTTPCSSTHTQIPTTELHAFRKVGPIRTPTLEKKRQEHLQQQQKRRNETQNDPSLLTNTRFSEREDIHPATIRGLTEVMGLTHFTEIQLETYSAEEGRDILGRARTGTGKTIAYLLPAVELSTRCSSPPGMAVLVLSPTRELAVQIHDEAEALLTHHPALSTQVFTGGTKFGKDISSLNKQLPSVVVATPGRLLDHLQNHSLRIHGKKFRDVLSKSLKVLILDEADRLLLDKAFRNQIFSILTYLPKKRWTMAFSATVPPSIHRPLQKIMKEYVFLDSSTKKKSFKNHTALLQQSYAVIPNMRLYVQALEPILQHAISQHPRSYKILVFFPAARIVEFFTNFYKISHKRVLELHSRKSQGHRTRVSREFRNAEDGVIMFTSDVSARGVDYPDVTHVIQYGLPQSRDQYIHRLGRTARAGRRGKGYLILSPFETPFLNELKGLPIPLDTHLDPLLQNLPKVPNKTEEHALGSEMAYQAFLGFYTEHLHRLGITKEELVRYAHQFCQSMGLTHVPELEPYAVDKMDLNGVDGVRIKRGFVSDEDLEQ